MDSETRGGERGLGIPNVVDRWVQQAVLQILEPIFEPRFHRSSHGFRANRGAHTAIAEAKQYLGLGGHPKPANEGHLKTGQRK